MPNARKTDPYTSHEAAESVVEVTETQLAIYGLLKKPMNDQNLITEYGKLVLSRKAPLASESGIRSRRAELVELELVERKGESKTWSGRKCIIWGQA
jgi:hypothetical protein